MFGWLRVPAAASRPTVGMPAEVDQPGERVLDRCEDCGAAVERGVEVDLEAELRALTRPGGDPKALATPNRASLQASLGGEGWAGLDRGPGELLHTPDSLGLLVERNGRAVSSMRFTRFGPNQGWMWQTLLNGLTFHPNFAREVRAGRLRPANARGRLSFYADLVATVLAAPLVAVLAVPLELVAAALRRGGEITAVLGVATSPGARRAGSPAAPAPGGHAAR